MERLSNLFFCASVFWNPHSSVNILRILHLHIFHNTPCLLPPPPNILHLLGHWDTSNTQGKLKAKVMQNLGATRCIMGDMQRKSDKDSVIRLLSWKKSHDVLVSKID